MMHIYVHVMCNSCEIQIGIVYNGNVTKTHTHTHMYMFTILYNPMHRTDLQAIANPFRPIPGTHQLCWGIPTNSITINKTNYNKQVFMH